MVPSSVITERRRTAPRLLADTHGQPAPVSLGGHRLEYSHPARPGPVPVPEITRMVADSGLQGRGGAGFPAARKWASVAAGLGPRVLVGNGTEGEPASWKDGMLMTLRPHLVLDGALIAARAVGAEEVVVCIDRANRPAVEAMQAAVAERRSEGSHPVSVATTPSRYVAGEETSLVRWLNGGTAQPTEAPPRPFQRGVAGRPTLVQNVESLAHVAQIARYGPEWFRAAGTPDEPGTALVSLSGFGPGPVVTEAPLGAPLPLVLEDAGAGIDEVQAVLVGGFFGAWITAEEADRASFSRAGLGPLGASPGAGIIIGLPHNACGLVETARVLGWFAGESAGQCGPCMFGLPSIAGLARELADGRLAPSGVDTLRRWAGQIEGRGACKHPDGAVRLLRSALRVFTADVETGATR